MPRKKKKIITTREKIRESIQAMRFLRHINSEIGGATAWEPRTMIVP